MFHHLLERLFAGLLAHLLVIALAADDGLQTAQDPLGDRRRANDDPPHEPLVLNEWRPSMVNVVVICTSFSLQTRVFLFFPVPRTPAGGICETASGCYADPQIPKSLNP